MKYSIAIDGPAGAGKSTVAKIAVKKAREKPSQHLVRGFQPRFQDQLGGLSA